MIFLSRKSNPSSWFDRGLPVLLTFLAVSVISSPALARVIHVGPTSEFTEIQPAIDASVDGDILLVQKGEYEIDSSINFGGKKIHLRSVHGSESTIIRPKESEDPNNSRGFSVFVFNHNEEIDSVLEGFTISGGKGVGSLTRLGGGIFIRGAHPLIRDCVIEGNQATYGGGIYMWEAHPRIQGCEIRNNHAERLGGGLYVYSNRPAINNCQIVDNSAKNGGGAGLEGNSEVVFQACQFEANHSEHGGALNLQEGAASQVINTLIAGNYADIGGAIELTALSSIRIINSTIAGNRADSGSGIQLNDASQARIINSIVAENDGEALAFQSRRSVNLTLANSLVDRTSSEDGTSLSFREAIVHRPHFIKLGHFEENTDGTPKWVSGDYRLNSNSPAINSGATQTIDNIALPQEDITGSNRPCWGSNDIGAYEYCGSVRPTVDFRLRMDIPIVFVERLHSDVRMTVRDSAVETSESGRLMIMKTDGTVEALIDASSQNAPVGTPTDVMDPDISFDGKSVVFSGYSPTEESWRIYQVDLDGQNFKQVTYDTRVIDFRRYEELGLDFSGFDDLDPCFLPDGGICFVSTRYVGNAPDHRIRATNLYVQDAGSLTSRRITSERFGADTPTVDPVTGNIVYSRWWRSNKFDLALESELPNNTMIDPLDIEPGEEDVDNPSVPVGSPGYGGGHVAVPRPPTAEEIPQSNFSEERLRQIDEDEFPGVNSWFLASIQPDGTDMKMFTGFHLDREATQAYRPVFQDDGKALALFIPVTPLLGQPGVFGLRRYERGPSTPELLGGPQRFAGSGTTAAQAIQDRKNPNLDFLYSSAVPLSSDSVLITAANRGNQRGVLPQPKSYDLFIQDGKDAPVLVYQGDGVYSVLDAVPVNVRKVPPQVRMTNAHLMRDDAPMNSTQAHEEGGTFRFTVENIWANAGVDVPIPNAPTFGNQKLFIEFYMAPQRESLNTPDEPILLQRLELPKDGRVSVELPASVPLFEMLRLEDGTVAQGRDGQIFHVGGMNFARAGGEGKCIGCHAGHSMVEVPENPQFFNLAPSAVVSASSSRSDRRTLIKFRPELLVDRSTAPLSSEWAANPNDKTPTVTLKWDHEVRMSELILHGPRKVVEFTGNRTAQIERILITAKDENGQVVHSSQQQTGLMTFEGMKIQLNDIVAQTLEIQILDATGHFENENPAALSEVQVIGTAVTEDPEPEFTFLRADTDCNGSLEMNDPVSTLSFLFLSGEKPCCFAAADANGDGKVNISDPIASLHYLYLGGTPPPAPFPFCGPQPESVPGELSCEVSSPVECP